MHQRFLVNGFQEARAERRVDFDRATDDFLCQFLLFHFDVVSILLILSVKFRPRVCA